MLSVCLLGGVLASGGQDRTIKLWSLSAADGAGAVDGADDDEHIGGCVATLAHGASVRGLALSSVANVVASAGGTDVNRLIVWRPAAHEVG